MVLRTIARVGDPGAGLGRCDGWREMDDKDRRRGDMRWSSNERTGRRRSVEDLRRAKQLLDAHVDNSPLAVIEFDPDFRVTRWAGSAERVFGYAAEEVMGKRIVDLHWVYEKDADLVASESAALFGGTKQRGVNMNRNYRKDGSVIWCEWYSSAIHDDEGRLLSVLSLVLDVTERKRAEKRARHELENTRLLLEVARALSSGRSLGEVFDAVCDAVLHGLEHSRVIVSLWDERLRSIETAASKGSAAVPAGEVVGIDDFSEAGRRIIEERKSAVIDYDDVAPGPAAQVGHSPSHLALGVPLVYGDRLVGLLTIDDPGLRRPFSDRDTEIAEGIASQAAIAIENARLFDDEKERARLSEAQTAVDRAVHASLDWRDVADRALEEAAVAIGAKSGCILGAEEGEWVVWSDFGHQRSITGMRFSDEQVRSGDEIGATGGAVTTQGPPCEERTGTPVVATARSDSTIRAPLTMRGETVALLVYHHKTRFHHFTPNEVTFVSRVASALSLSLENARLYESERDISHLLQEALLTLPDGVEGIEFAHAYHSAAEAARVGGDFYDLFEVGAGLIGMTIGDVAGKGLDAAVLTSLAKNTIRAHAMERGKTPAQVLVLTNAVLYAATPPESFVTAFFGLFDRHDGTLTYASAGHTPGAILRGDGTTVRLPSTGPLLGAFDRIEMGQSVEHVSGGDLLFLYTDGLTEARRDHELYGERVFEQLTAGVHEPLAVVRRIVDDVLSYTDHRLTDDMALLVVKRLQSDEAAGSPGTYEI